jgi:hypothetical protein
VEGEHPAGDLATPITSKNKKTKTHKSEPRDETHKKMA